MIRLSIAILICAFTLITARPDADYRESNQIDSFELKKWLTGISFAGSWSAKRSPSNVITPFFRLSNNSMISTNNTKSQPFLSAIQLQSCGSIELFFDSSSASSLSNLAYADKIYMQLRCRNKLVALEMALTNVSTLIETPSLLTPNIKTMSIWRRKNALVVATLFYLNQNLNLQEIVKIDISAILQISISQGKYKSEYPSFNSLPITILFQSPSMSFTAEASPISYSSIIPYAFAALTVILAVIVFKFAHKTDDNESESARRSMMFRISQWFILQQFLFLIAINAIVISICLKRIDTVLSTCLYACIANIILGLFYLRNYEPILMKFGNCIKRISAPIFLAIYFYCVQKYYLMGRFWIFEGAVLYLLQIFHSIKNGSKGGLPLSLNAFILVSRIPLFYLMISSQFLEMKTSPAIVETLIGAMLFGWFITLVQQRFSSRFMIPNQLIPDYHNYFKKAAINSEELKQTCSICTFKLCQNPTQPEQDNPNNQQNTEVVGAGAHQDPSSIEIEMSSTISEKAEPTEANPTNFVTYMKGPCGHCFHSQCLKPWMQTKLVCPNCRTDLPPYERQDI